MAQEKERRLHEGRRSKLARVDEERASGGCDLDDLVTVDAQKFSNAKESILDTPAALEGYRPFHRIGFSLCPSGRKRNVTSASSKLIRHKKALQQSSVYRQLAGRIVKSCGIAP